MEFTKYEYSTEEALSSQESNLSLSSNVYPHNETSSSCFNNGSNTNLDFLPQPDYHCPIMTQMDPSSYSRADTTGQLNNLVNYNNNSFPIDCGYENYVFTCSQNSNIENECLNAEASGSNSFNFDNRCLNSNASNNTYVEAPMTIRPANSYINSVNSMLMSSPISGSVFNSNNATDNKANNTMTPGELEQKLFQKRERNRIAARKCRDKKLNKIKEYEQKITILQSEVQREEREVAKLIEYKNRLRRLFVTYLLYPIKSE